MAIVKTTSKKQYAIEAEMKLRFLASGTKLTDAVVDLLGIRPGYKDAKGDLVQGETINSAKDPETGKVYIYKGEAGEGYIVSQTKTFTSTALRTLAFGLAKGQPIMKDKEVVGTMAVDTEIKDKLQVTFDVSETPVVEDGVKYFEITFNSAEVPSRDEDSEEVEVSAPKEVKVKATASVSDSDNF